MISFDATWNPIEQLDLNIGGVLVGPRQNNNGAGSANKMHNYCLVHTTVGWKFNENFKVYGRIDNLLNENYATVDSYGIIYNTYGRVYYLGMTYSFYYRRKHKGAIHHRAFVLKIPQHSNVQACHFHPILRSYRLVWTDFGHCRILSGVGRRTRRMQAISS